MKNNKWIMSLALALVLGSSLMSGCVSTGSGKGIQALEQMSELDFKKWQLYIKLGVKIGANRLLREQVVTAEELNIAATAIETVRDQTGIPGTESFIEDALADAGLNNDEIELLLVIVEQELIARGALNWINPETSLIEWSPRTKEMLTIVANALRTATSVTEDEVEEGKQLEYQFNGKIIAGQAGPGSKNA